MRRIIKTIIKSVKEYDEAMWGDGGYYDSLAGEEIGFGLQEKKDKAYKPWNDLISIYSNKSGVPQDRTLLEHGLDKDDLDIIKAVEKRIEKKGY